jgi:hypothetical protein
LNEAFAAQSLAVIQQANLDAARVNPNGGAIALGHPLGCTGAKLTASLIRELQRQRPHYGMVTMCIGGGMAPPASSNASERPLAIFLLTREGFRGAICRLATCRLSSCGVFEWSEAVLLILGRVWPTNLVTATASKKDIQKLSDDRVRLSTTALYGALRRLLEDGWIARF